MAGDVITCWGSDIVAGDVISWLGTWQLNVFSYFVILSSFIPLSLMVSLELASFAQVTPPLQ